MYIKIRPDDDVEVKKIKVGNVSTLIVTPKKTKKIDVGILWIHGGGYISGIKEIVFMSRAIDLVKKYGVTVFSPGYRLSWISPYPAAFNDCYDVLEYMDIHKSEYGISRIMVGGESAGGGLACAVCMKARDEKIHISYQMPLYPMISNIDTESSKDNHGKNWNTFENHVGWRIYLRRNAKKKVSPYASPSQQTDYSNLAPCYTFVGNGEPFYVETLEYIDNLKKAGVEAKVDIYETNVHAFDMLNPDDELSKTAISNFEKQFEYALENYK